MPNKVRDAMGIKMLTLKKKPRSFLFKLRIPCQKVFDDIFDDLFDALIDGMLRYIN